MACIVAFAAVDCVLTKSPTLNVIGTHCPGNGITLHRSPIPSAWRHGRASHLQRMKDSDAVPSLLKDSV